MPESEPLRDIIFNLINITIPTDIICECERENIVEFDLEKLTDDIMDKVVAHITRGMEK